MLLSKIISDLSLAVICVFCTFVIVWLTCANYNGVHHVSIQRNLISGKLQLNESGIHITPPWVQVFRIDTRPITICVECTCRNLACTQIAFNKDGWLDFINKEGMWYYWWANRISFNISHQNEYRGMPDILRGYAFDSHKYPFLIYYK